MDIRSTRNLKTALLGVAATLAVVVGSGPSAKADFLFNPAGTGAGGAQSVALFDPTAGNALAVNGVTAINAKIANPASNPTFTLLYQASVGSISNGNGQSITSGTFAGLNSTQQITVVASITETVLSATGNTATFSLTPGPNDFLRIYANPTFVKNDLAGTGFTAGTLILDARPVGSGANGSFTNQGTPPVQFDQFVTNEYPGITSVSGTGSSTVSFAVNSLNSSYFVGLTPSAISLRIDTSNTTPFTSVNPSRAFFDGTLSSIGAINGTSGPSFQFQADGLVPIVPEPSSVCLMGLGLIGVVAHVRRKRNQNV